MVLDVHSTVHGAVMGAVVGAEVLVGKVAAYERGIVTGTLEVAA